MRLIVGMVGALALVGCDDGKVTLCNYWPEKSPVVPGELMGMWEFRDPADGCRYISGEVHGTYTRAASACYGPQVCRTITNEEWAMEKAAAPAEPQP